MTNLEDDCPACKFNNCGMCGREFVASLKRPPLTDGQLRDIAREVAPGQMPQSVFAHWPGLKAFARAVEQAHGIGA